MKTKMILTAALSALAASIPFNVLAAPTEITSDAPAIVVTDDENGEKTVAVSTEIDEDSADTHSLFFTVTEEGVDGSVVVLAENDEFDNLTEDEAAELKELFAQQNAIYNEVLDGNPELTGKEFDAAQKERQPELDQIGARIAELLKKAGVETVSLDDAVNYSGCISITDENDEIEISTDDDNAFTLSDDEIAEITENGTLTKTIYISDEN